MVISIDYPFYGWHELTICYRADGWDLASRKVIDVPRTGAAVTLLTGRDREELAWIATLIRRSLNLPADKVLEPASPTN